MAVFLSASVLAQSPREELDRFTRELQQSPTNNALREKIIKLGLSLKPPPRIPEEAERRLARGEAAFERAKDAVEYSNAIRELQAAVAAAPWLPAAYFNLGAAQEKADQPNDAIVSFRWYLLAAPEASDAAEVKKRIFKLEYAAEQKAAGASAKQAAMAAQEKRLTGDWRRRPATGTGDPALEILHVGVTADRQLTFSYDFFVGNRQIEKNRLWNVREASIIDGELRFQSIWTDAAGSAGICAAYDVRGNVSPDGNNLSLAYTLLPFAANRPDTCSLPKYYGSHTDTYSR
ncbi:MAG TPA: hypothetical protein VM166_07005 [Gemmatimonadaceae bacterium]|nr:hypothetical protein [Gemmatimonadaceae bacterium]